MFTKKTDKEFTLDRAIDSAFADLTTFDIETEEYQLAVARLAELHKIKKDIDRRVSPDAMAMVVGNLAGIVLIVGHERAHVLTSKAINFVMKAK